MSNLNGKVTGKYIVGRFEKFMLSLDSRPAPYKEFKQVMALNGWYWEPYGSVVHVIVECRNLARIERIDEPTLYKTMPELRTWLGKMGYEKEDENA